MKHVFLHRYYQSAEATLGLLTIQGKEFPKFYTLERPWLDNTQYVSCIPEGTYLCKPFSGSQYKDVFEVTDVEGRTSVLFHWGNYVRNSEGCILVGEYHKPLVDSLDGKLKDAVCNSRSAFNRFANEIGDDEEFKLTIVGGTTNWS